MSLVWFNGLLIVWFGVALLSFGTLLWKPAPYGRYLEPGWGRPLNARSGWLLMETPAVLVLPAFFLAGERTGDPVLQIFLLVWLLHYVHRAWIYPFRKKAGREMPLGLALCAMAFNLVNGGFNGGWLFHVGPVYPRDWLTGPQFLVGIAVFAIGFAVNVHADSVLIRMRRRSSEYAVPRGGLFERISCPNYFGEILEWIGWAIMTWSWVGLSFAVWTAANLVPRALTHHRFYRATLEGYPSMRKAILPYVIGLTVFVVACDARTDAPPPIVLISVDTLRADHVSAYGYARPTPNIDALAASGVLFEEAHSVAPWTLPAHMTMLTGLYPSTHGVDNEGFALGAGVPTLAERLTAAGYRSAGFVAHHYLAPTYGFDRGFDDGYTYRQYLNDPRDPAGAVRGDAIVDEAIDYLERSKHDDRPYFLFVHLFDPHWTYAAPAPYSGVYSSGYTGSMDGTLGKMMPAIAARRPLPPADLQQLIDLYDEEIAWVDHLIGELVAKIRGLPGGKRAVIVLTSDHGEEFEEHGALGHSVTLYREQTHVPLIFADPRGPRGRRSNAVSLIDLAPSIAKLAGLPDDDPLIARGEGRALRLDIDPVSAGPLLMETTRYGHPRAAALVGTEKAIAAMDYDIVGIRQTADGPQRRVAATWRRRTELYDVDGDPFEQRPLQANSRSGAVEALRLWQDASWRGVRLAVNPTEGWRVRLRFPPATEWFDEPWMADGTHALRLEVVDDALELGGFPPGRTYEIGLPMYLDGDSPVLLLEGLTGRVLLPDGDVEVSLGPGETREIDLSAAELLAAGPPGSLDPGRLGIRTRPRPRQGEVSIDPETRRLLQSLGYVGN